MGRVALLAAVLALLGAAAARADGFRRHSVAGAGVSVVLPVGWQVLGQRDAVFPGARQLLTRVDASFALPLAELGVPDSPLKLFAFDRRFRRGHPTTMLVVQATYGKPGRYSRWSPQIERGFAGRSATFRHVDLPAGESLRATYRNRLGETVVTYVVPGRTGLWALMLRTPTARAASDERLLDRAARSLELGAPVGGATLAPAGGSPGS